MYDAVVIGGGPAGCSAAVVLAQAGRRVALVEKAAFPRHKVCGEFLSASCRGALKRLGVLDSVNAFNPPEISRAVLATAAEELIVPFELNGRGLPFGISRYRLDELLLRRAAQLGVEVLMPAVARSYHPPTTPGPNDIDVRIEANGTISSVRTRNLIIADGRIRGLARAGRNEPKQSDQLGIKAHFEGVEFERGSVELYGFDGGYVGLSPIEGGRANVCAAVKVRAYRQLGNDPQRWLDSAFAQNLRFAKRMRNARIAADWLVTPLPRFGYRRICEPGVFAIGTAAAAFDPIVGEGIWMAMFSGMRIADLLVGNGSDADNSAVSRDARSSFLGQFRLRDLSAKLIVGLSRSRRMSDFAIRLLRRSPGLVRMLMVGSGKR